MASSHTLELTDLRVRRGSLEVVREVTLALDAGACVGLLGLNGAGKTTLLAAIAGTLPLAGGDCCSRRGRPVASAQLDPQLSWHRSGPGGQAVVGAKLSVADNLLVGAHAERSRKVRAERLEQALRVFSDPPGQAAGNAPGNCLAGQQQMVAFARGLMAAPRVLLLDEPSEGLAPVMIDTIFEAIITMRKANDIALLLAEQNAGLTKVCDSVLVMRDGVISQQVDDAAIGDVATSVLRLTTPAISSGMASHRVSVRR